MSPVVNRLAPSPVLLAVLLAGCHSAGGAGFAPAPRTAAFDDFGVDRRAAPAEDAEGMMLRAEGSDQGGSLAAIALPDVQAGREPGQQERMLIYSGSVTVEVARVEDAIAEFLGKVGEWGGYLSRQRGTTLSVRVPADRFDTAFEFLRTMGRLLQESREANDVTEEFMDLGIRLDNAKRSRERLLELLAKADKVEDMLKIEEQLRRLTEEIERMEGRRRFLADQVAMATLQATFQPVAQAPDRPAVSPSPFPWIRQLGAERLLGRW